MDILLNWLLMPYHYTHKLTNLSTFIREASTCRLGWTQIFTTNQVCKISPSYTIVSQPLLQSLGAPWIREGRRNWRGKGGRRLQETVPFEHRRTAAYMNSPHLWEHAQAPCKLKWSQISVCREGGSEVTHLAREPLATGSFWERENPCCCCFFNTLPMVSVLTGFMPT